MFTKGYYILPRLFVSQPWNGGTPPGMDTEAMFNGASSPTATWHGPFEWVEFHGESNGKNHGKTHRLIANDPGFNGKTIGKP